MGYRYESECVQLTSFDCDTIADPKCGPFVSYEEYSCPILKCEHGAVPSTSVTTVTTTSLYVPPATTKPATSSQTTTLAPVSCVSLFAKELFLYIMILDC